MTAKEIVEASLAALDIVIGWPIAILIVVLLFRKQIEYLFGVLSGRLRRISVGGATAEFSPPLREAVTRSRVSSERVDELEGDDSEISEYDHELEGDDSEISEYNEELDRL